MKHFFFLLITMFLTVNSRAQKLITHYDFKPIIDSLSLDMRTKGEFEFVSYGKHGYCTIYDRLGVIVPPNFKSVEKIKNQYGKSDIAITLVDFFKVKYGQFYGAYRYYDGDTIQMLPCKYLDVECVLLKTDLYLIAKKKMGSDTFKALGPSQMPIIKTPDQKIKIKKDLELDSDYDYSGTFSDEIVDVLIDNNRPFDVDATPRTIYNTPFKIEKDKSYYSNKLGVFNSIENKWILPCTCSKIKFLPKNELFVCYNDSVAEVYNKNGILESVNPDVNASILKGDFSNLNRKKTTLVKWLKSNQFGLIDREFNWLIMPVYSNAKKLSSNRYYAFIKEDNWLIYDAWTKSFKKKVLDDLNSDYDYNYRLVTYKGDLTLMDSNEHITKTFSNYKFVRTVDSLSIIRRDSLFMILNLNTGHKGEVIADDVKFLGYDKKNTNERSTNQQIYLVVKYKGKIGLKNCHMVDYLPQVYDSLKLTIHGNSENPAVLLMRDGLYYYHSIEKNQMLLDSLSKLYFFHMGHVVEPFSDFYLGTVFLPVVVKRNSAYHKVEGFLNIKFIPRTFDSVLVKNRDYWITKKNDKFAVWNIKKDEFWADYDSVNYNSSSMSEYFFMFKGGRCMPVFKEKMKLIEFPVIEYVTHLYSDSMNSNFKNSNIKRRRELDQVYVTVNKEKKGLLFSNGEITEVVFDDMYYNEKNKLIWVKYNGKWGYYKIKK